MGACSVFFNIKYGSKRYNFKIEGEVLKRYEIAEILFKEIKDRKPPENTIFGRFSEIVTSAGFSSNPVSGSELILFTIRPEEKRSDSGDLFLKYAALLSTYSDSEGLNFINLISDILNYVRNSRSPESFEARSKWASDLIASHIIPTYVYGFKKFMKYVVPISEYKGEDLIKSDHGIFIKPPLKDDDLDVAIETTGEKGIPSGSPPVVFYVDYSSFDYERLYELLRTNVKYEDYMKAISHISEKAYHNLGGFYIQSEDFADVWDLFKIHDLSEYKTVDSMVRLGSHVYPAFYERGRNIDEKIVKIAYNSDIIRQNFDGSLIKIQNPEEDSIIAEFEISDIEESLYDYSYHYDFFVSYRRNTILSMAEELSVSGDPYVKRLFRKLKNKNRTVEELIKDPLFNVLDGFETLYAYIVAEADDINTDLTNIEDHREAIRYLRDVVNSPLYGDVSSMTKMKILNTLMFSENILNIAEDKKSSDMIVKGEVAKKSIFIKNIISKC